MRSTIVNMESQSHNITIIQSPTREISEILWTTDGFYQLQRVESTINKN